MMVERPGPCVRDTPTDTMIPLSAVCQLLAELRQLQGEYLGQAMMVTADGIGMAIERVERVIEGCGGGE